MTIRIFRNFADLNAALAFDLIDRLDPAEFDARFGASNVSESAYVEVALDADDDSETVKIRFSGHSDRHGANITLRTDYVATAIYAWDEAGDPLSYDDDGEPTEWAMISRTGPESEPDAEFSHVEIASDALAALLDEAFAYVTARKMEVEA